MRIPTVKQKNAIGKAFSLGVFRLSSIANPRNIPIAWQDNVAITSFSTDNVVGAGTNSWNSSGNASVQAIPAGSVEFRIKNNGDVAMLGLSQNNPDANYTSIEFAYFNSGANNIVYESATLRATLAGAPSTANIVRINFAAGVPVKYYLNNALAFTSPTNAPALLRIDTAFSSANSGYTDIVFTPAY